MFPFNFGKNYLVCGNYMSVKWKKQIALVLVIMPAYTHFQVYNITFK